MSEKQKVVSLECNCCGAGTKGRQWPNRDTGYGLCARCGDEQEKKYGAEQVENWSGKRGINWDVKTPS